MFGFRRHKKTQERPQRLNLATDDRASARSTLSSDELAKELLSVAQKKAQNVKVGTEVQVTIDETRLSVHLMELLVSITTLQGQYGLRLAYQFSNTLTFTKI